MEPLTQRRSSEQRLRQPRLDQTPAHRRARVIDHAEQRELIVLATQCGGELQVAACRRIERHEFAGGIRTQAGQLRQRPRLRLFEILHNRSGSTYGQRFAIEPEAGQRRHLKMIEQTLPRLRRFKMPGRKRREVNRCRIDRRPHHRLAAFFIGRLNQALTRHDAQ
jgi:hypothetical protein